MGRRSDRETSFTSIRRCVRCLTRAVLYALRHRITLRAGVTFECRVVAPTLRYLTSLRAITAQRNVMNVQCIGRSGRSLSPSMIGLFADITNEDDVDKPDGAQTRRGDCLLALDLSFHASILQSHAPLTRVFCFFAGHHTHLSPLQTDSLTNKLQHIQTPHFRVMEGIFLPVAGDAWRERGPAITFSLSSGDDALEVR